MRRLIAVLLVLAALPAAAQRRRAASQPSIDPSTPAGWLAANATQLVSTELLPFSYDLAALRTMIGNATTVGLGDDTHGTHEFETVKLRIIDFLVREMGFETVAFEAAFPRYRELNAYVLGGSGNPREILAASRRELGYFFWNTEEILAVIEWMRDYNAHRGSKPPVEIAGFDYYDQARAANDVVSYLAAVDPSFSADAASSYGCVPKDQFTFHLPEACAKAIVAIRERLASNRDAFVARTSRRSYDEALQSATIVIDHFGDGNFVVVRDATMAKNALWLKQHYGSSGRIILWAHQVHVGKTRVPIGSGWDSMGMHLAQALGDDYFVIGTCTLRGTFMQWFGTGVVTEEAKAFRPAAPESYEAFFQSARIPRLLIPLRGSVPDWLKGPRDYRFAAASSSTNETPDAIARVSLPAQLDAIIYIEETAPVRTLPP